MISIFEWLKIGLTEGMSPKLKKERALQRREEEKKRIEAQRALRTQAILNDPNSIEAKTLPKHETPPKRRDVDETKGPQFQDEECRGNFTPIVDLTTHAKELRIPERAPGYEKQVEKEIIEILNLPVVKCTLVNMYKDRYNGFFNDYHPDRKPFGSTNDFGIVVKENDPKQEISLALVVEERMIRGEKKWVFTVKTFYLGLRDDGHHFWFEPQQKIIAVNKKFRPNGWMIPSLKESNMVMTFESFLARGLSHLRTL